MLLKNIYEGVRFEKIRGSCIYTNSYDKIYKNFENNLSVLDCSKYTEAWYKNSRFHRLRGPSETCKNEKYKSKFWHLNGKKMIYVRIYESI